MDTSVVMADQLEVHDSIIYWNLITSGRGSTNFQNQEVQDFQPSKSGSEVNET